MMGKRINTGLYIDEEILRAVEEDAKKTPGFSVSRQIEYELGVTRGLWKAVTPYLPRPRKPQPK
jgi:hypothetical protein